MQLNSQNKTINILVAGLPRAERHAMAILLPKRLRRPIRIFDTGAQAAVRPDVILVSFSGTRSCVQQMEALQKHHPQAPVICIAKKSCPDAPISVPWPISINTLAERIESALTHTATGRETVSKGSLPHGAHAAPQTRTAWTTFDPAHKLLGKLMRAHKRCKETGLAIELNTKSLGAYLFLPDNQVLTTTGHRTLRSLCAVSLVTSHFTINAVPPERLENLKNARYSTAEQWPLEKFFWHVGHWSSRGQLPKNIGKHQVLRMKRWPNATHAPEPLTAIAISALLGNTPASPVTISHRLGISTSSIAAYVSGMYAAGLLTDNSLTQPEPAPKKPLAARPGKVLKKLARRLFGQWRHHSEISNLSIQ